MVASVILGAWLGQRALQRRLVNGVTGVIALFIILCFALTTIFGWCAFLRHSQQGALFFTSWVVVLFSAWLGMFAASLRQAWLEFRTPVSSWKFSSLSDKYEIVYDDPRQTGKVKPVLVGKENTSEAGKIVPLPLDMQK